MNVKISQRSKEIEKILVERRKGVDVKETLSIVNSFLVEKIGNCLFAGLPKKLLFPIKVVWIVPVMLGYPKAGVIGEVGVVAVDAEEGNIIAWTPKKEIERIARKLYYEQKNDIEIAYL